MAAQKALDESSVIETLAEWYKALKISQIAEFSYNRLMSQKTNLLIGLTAVLVVIFGLWGYQWDLTELERFLIDHSLAGTMLYVLLLAGSVVLLPLSSLPLLPIAAHIWGVWITALLSILGWWTGSLIAFQLARYGRNILGKFVSLESLDATEKKIPRDISFMGIVLLRMILPVDVTSFALGLLRHLSFTTYAVASLIGIIPFAFVWSYAGGELATGQYASFIGIIVLMTGIVFLIRHFWNRQ